MAARPRHVSMPIEDLRRLQLADRIAHGAWDPHAADTRPSAVSREFGRLRWVVVPLAGVAAALVVWAIGCLAGAPA